MLLFTALDLASITSHIHSWVSFLLWLHPFILSGIISPLISSSILAMLVIAFLARSKCLLFSWLQSPSTVILELPQIKSLTVSICFPIYLPWNDGTDAKILVFWIFSESKASKGVSGEITPERMKRWSQSKNNTQLWMWLVQSCKEQYCIGSWNVRSMNQGKLEVIKQEMARVKVDILGIRELKWTRMGEFNADH